MTDFLVVLNTRAVGSIFCTLSDLTDCFPLTGYCTSSTEFSAAYSSNGILRGRSCLLVPLHSVAT